MHSGVGKSVKKIDAMALVTGQPVYTEDLEPANALVVKLLRSPHAHAVIRKIDKTIALKVPGIEAIYTYEDVEPNRFTLAGQSFPEPSPYDRLILDRHVRYVGDEVCIIAGTSHAAVDKAINLIKVDYQVLEAVVDYEKALDHEVIIHPEDDYKVNFDIGNAVKRNLCASGFSGSGDVDQAFEDSDLIVEHQYYTKANNQTAMEPFKTYTTMDAYGRITVVSSTQVPFHIRRIVAKALNISSAKVKVVKPRIGGGFGAKQTLVTELFPAFVTYKTGKAAKLYYTREESFSSSTSRHAMRVSVKVGATYDGQILGIQMHTLSNTGAYGEHGPTTVGLTATKNISLYNKSTAYRFDYDVVYTNTMSAGAFRGYGATQGCFALESAINELAHKLDIDPVELRLKNILEQGEEVSAYNNEVLNSCALEACIHKGKEMIGWDDKYPSYITSEGKQRSIGMAITMQGSGISDIDIASVKLHLNESGIYTLMIGATDMGTGCDTILAQMASECLGCPMEDIIVHGVDTDVSPYDTGSYASSTTYVTGGAVVKACELMIKKIKEEGAKALNLAIDEVEFDGIVISSQEQRALSDGQVEEEHGRAISLVDLSNQLAVGDHNFLVTVGSNSMPVSPPPFMAGFVEIEADTETMAYDVVKYVGVVDCGTVINPALARIQVEGGIVQGIGMAMHEDIVYNASGKMMNNSFLKYKIPSRLDTGIIEMTFETSYEPTGPFGAKSIGEIVINTPNPAIAHALHNSFGVYMRSLPMTPEKIFIEKMMRDNISDAAEEVLY